VRRAGPGDDLLTAGLGLQGLRDPVLPEGVSARTAAIHKDFRDFVDLSACGGFGSFVPHAAQGLRVNGWEYAALLRLPGSQHPFGVRLLVPDNFDWDRPVLVVAPSSGSRGVTGSIGDIGAWALPGRCALVLTDKATGGAHLLGDDTCYGPDLEPAASADTPSVFRLKQDSAYRRFQRRHPQAIALKHAHSGENLEALWPQAVLLAARFGLGILEHRGERGRPASSTEKVRVIAAGVSNGGGAVLRAAELDKQGILHGVVAVEPNITPRTINGSTVRIGDAPPSSPGRRLADYATAMNLLLPAALLAPELADAPFNQTQGLDEARRAAWAEGLARHGLIEGTDTPARASDALRRIGALGFGEGCRALFPMMSMMHIWPAVSHTFVSALGRFPVEADPIGAHVAFARTDTLGQVLDDVAPPTEEQRRLYGALGGGLSPGGGAFTIHASGDIHPSLEDALQLRQLALGKGHYGHRVSTGAAQVLAEARSTGLPTVILHGRCDSLISVQHASRAYFAATSASGSDMREWRYYEHETGQHFELLLGMPGLSQRFTPILPSLYQSLDLMRERLFSGGALPPSQVLRAPLPDECDESGLAIRRNLSGNIAANPGRDAIEFSGNSLCIPI